MKKYLALAGCLLLVHPVFAADLPPWVAPLKAYANSLGCSIDVNPANHFKADLNDDGQAEIVALFQADLGCFRGTGTSRSLLAVLEDSAGQGRDYHVRADMSAPGIPMLGFPRWIERIRLNKESRFGQFWLTGREQPDGDPLADEVPVEGPFTLQSFPVSVPSGDGETFTQYCWTNGSAD